MVWKFFINIAKPHVKLFSKKNYKIFLQIICDVWDSPQVTSNSQVKIYTLRRMWLKHYYPEHLEMHP